MKKLIIVLVLLLAVSLSAIEQDKAIHFQGALFTNLVVTQYCYHYTDWELKWCDGFGYWGTLLLCVGKEIIDERWSDEDLLAGFIGINIGVILNHKLLHDEYLKLLLDNNTVGLEFSWRF